jgi:hypothetical protein
MAVVTVLNELALRHCSVDTDEERTQAVLTLPSQDSSRPPLE